MENKRKESIDEILENLGRERAADASVSSMSVDDIMAELGLGAEDDLLHGPLPAPAAGALPEGPAEAEAAEALPAEPLPAEPLEKAAEEGVAEPLPEAEAEEWADDEGAEAEEETAAEAEKEENELVGTLRRGIGQLLKKGREGAAWLRSRGEAADAPLPEEDEQAAEEELPLQAAEGEEPEPADAPEAVEEAATAKTWVFHRSAGEEPAETAPAKDSETEELPGEEPDTAAVEEDSAGKEGEEPAAPAAKKKFSLSSMLYLLGVPKKQEGEPFEDEAENGEPMVEDYESLEDAPVIRTELTMMWYRLRARTVGTGVLALLLLYMGAAAGGLLPLPAPFAPENSPAGYLIVQILLMLGVGAINRNTLINGLEGINGTPSPDCVPMLALVGALLQSLCFLLGGNLYDPYQNTLFAGPAALLMCGNALGKAFITLTACRNFELVCTGLNRNAAFCLQDDELVTRLASDLSVYEPHILLSRPTSLMKGFMEQSFSVKSNETHLRWMNYALLGAAVLGAILSFFAGHSLADTFSVPAGTFCLAGPLAGTLVTAIPAFRMHQSAARVGAVVPGWSSIDQLAEANIVECAAADLFPRGTVRMCGTKMFQGEQVDKAIIYAASLLRFGGTAAKDLFAAMVQNDPDLLLPVELVSSETGLGVGGYIDGDLVQIGSRGMMKKHGVEVPAMAYEKRFTPGERSPIYVAVNGELYAMFLVSYKADPSVRQALNRLCADGFSLLVDSDDFCVNTETVETAYELQPGFVKVLTSREQAMVASACDFEDVTEGCMLHLGSFVSLSGGIRAAARARANERAGSLVLLASVGFGVLLSLVLAFAGGIGGMALPVVMLYQAVWCAFTLALPVFRKY